MNELSKELKKDGYDGLFFSGECACLLGDLCPCGEKGIDCEPGYKKTYSQLTEDQKKGLTLDSPWFVMRDK